MGVLVLLCFAAATLVAAGAAFWRPANPAPFNLLAVAVFFLALGFALMTWTGQAG